MRTLTMTAAQAVLGGISLGAPEFKGPDSQLALEAFTIFRHIGRISRGMKAENLGLLESDPNLYQLWLRWRSFDNQED